MKEQFVMKVAKLVIAAAWCDNELTADEVNSMKDLVFHLPELSAEHWSQLDIYMEFPVCADERERLLTDVIRSMRSARDKKLVIERIRMLVESDGEITEQERAVLEHIENSVDVAEVSFFSQVSNLFSSAIERRKEVAHCGIDREEKMDDFIKNRIYFQLVTELQKQDEQIVLSDEQVRKLCFAGGLMARVAWVDSSIEQEEKGAIVSALEEHWGLSRSLASLVCEISISRVVRDLDYYRLSRGFYECTTAIERCDFLKVLFQIANASNRTSNEEIEEIRHIANSLKVDRQDFISAKQSISSEDRNGL